MHKFIRVTDLSVVKTELARELKRALILHSKQAGDLRELGSAVADVLQALELESSDPDTKSSIVIGVLIKYGHYHPTNEEIGLLVKISEAPATGGRLCWSSNPALIDPNIPSQRRKD